MVFFHVNRQFSIYVTYFRACYITLNSLLQAASTEPFDIVLNVLVVGLDLCNLSALLDKPDFVKILSVVKKVTADTDLRRM